MKKDDVQLGGTYVAKVSGSLTTVRIQRESQYGGWDAINTVSGRPVRIKSAQRLRYAANRRAKVVEAPPDRDVCATVGCGGQAVIEHLGRPRCQKCWEDECANEQQVDAMVASDSSESISTGDTNVATKTKTTKSSKTANRKPSARKPKADGAPKRVSALDAAAQVLKAKGEAMRATELIAAMAEKGLWTSPGGKTPHATLYAAIIREIGAKGKDARFRKVEAGKFEYAGGR